MVVWSPVGNDAMGCDRFLCVEPVQLDPVAIPPGKFKETKVGEECCTVPHIYAWMHLCVFSYFYTPCWTWALFQ